VQGGWRDRKVSLQSHSIIPETIRKKKTPNRGRGRRKFTKEKRGKEASGGKAQTKIGRRREKEEGLRSLEASMQ